MSTTTYADFESEARREGYDEVLERRWAPATVIETHTHDFDVAALLAEGEMWLTEGGATKHLRAGDRFTLAGGLPHAERYGPQGTVLWVARRRSR